MQTSSCAPGCSSTPLAVNIPGPSGPTGPYPITTTTANFTIPAVGSNVTVSVVSTFPFVVGQNVFLGGVNYTIFSINNPTSLTLTALGFPGDLTGVTASGSTMVGGVGNLANPTSITTGDFVIPVNNLSTVEVPVTNRNSFALGQNVFIGTRTFGANFLIQNFGSGTLILQYLGVSGDETTGGTISAGAVVRGGIGNYGGTGGYAIISQAFTVPAVGSTVTISIGPVYFLNPFVVGQNVYCGGSNFIVTATDAGVDILVTLKNLGFPGDSAVGTVISAGKAIFAGTGNVTSFGQAPTVANGYAVYGAGTAYTLTTTPAAVTLGTTSPALTFALAGTYLIFATAQIDLVAAKNGALVDSINTTLLLHQTAAATGDIANTSATIKWTTPVVANAYTYSLGVVHLQPVVFTALAGDVIKVYGSINQSPTTSGTVSISAASIVAVRIS